MKMIINTKSIPVVALACFAFALMQPQSALAADAPKDDSGKASVRLLEVPDIEPGPDKTGEIKGKVTGLAVFKGYRIVIYSKGGDIWYVQPTVLNPFTEIGDDGEFSADIHGGTDYAALLVKDTYKPKAQIERLPVRGGEVLAITRRQPGKSEK